MKKAISISLLIIGLGQAALASHPHDRVCVNSAPLEFVLQYSMGRTYQNGNANLDPHKVAAEAYYSVGDYMDLPAEKFTSEAVVVKAQGPKKIPLTLKSTKGDILLKGTTDVSNEQLVGTFTDGLDHKSVTATTKLKCVSQPRLTLESSDQDIAE